MTKRPTVIQLAQSGSLGRLLENSNPEPDFSSSRCAGLDPELFFSDNPLAQVRAKAVCANCPIISECATWAMRNAEFGIFGGLTAEERANAGGSPKLETTITVADLKRELDFVMKASSTEVSLRYQVDARTVVRWRNILRTTSIAS